MQPNTAKLEEKFLDGVIEIENESFAHPWSREAYLAELKNPMAHYIVLTQENAVVAYGGFWQILDEGHITNIAVKKSERGRGLGTVLMRRLLSEAQKLKITALTLEVRASNTAAQHLYQKFGFQCAGIRPGYYPDGESAVIMWREELYC